MGINDNMAVHTEKSATSNGVATTPDFTVKAGLAQMLKGGVIMDVVNAEQVPFPLQFLYGYFLPNTSIPGTDSRRIRRLRCHGSRACPCRHPA